MVSALTNLLTNPALANITQSTTQSVSIETCMKAVGRPSFILADQKLDKKTKHYAAMKEFLYQLTCLGIYLALVVPVFRQGAFKLGGKIFKKMPEGESFKLFKNANEYLRYHRYADMDKADRIKAMDKKGKNLKLSENLKNILSNEEEPNSHGIIKGIIELGNIVGCVIGLAIVSPKVSHYIIHPALKLMGFEKPEQKQSNAQEENNLNVNA